MRRVGTSFLTNIKINNIFKNTLNNKNMKKTIEIIIGTLFSAILIFIIFHLINSYSLIFKEFYNMFNADYTWQTYFIASGYALSSLFIIFFYSNNNKNFQLIVKLVFVFVDALILAVIYNEMLSNYMQIAVYLFAVYTGLILYFIGELGSRYVSDLLSEKDSEKSGLDYLDLQLEFERLEEKNEDLENTLEGLNENNADFEITIEDLNKTIQDLTDTLAITNKTKQDFELVSKDYNLLSKDLKTLLPIAMSKLKDLANMRTKKTVKDDVLNAIFQKHKSEFYTFENNKYVEIIK